MCMKYFWVAALTALTFVAWASSRQVILVNKPGSSGWHWETKKTPGKDISGWTTRASPTRYAACDVSLPPSNPHPDNWLISDQISIRDANRIDITVDYFITSCSTFPNNGGSYCENVFDLYVNHSDQLIADKSQYPDPLSNRVAYEKTAAIRQATNKRISETINVLVKGKYVILAFHNYGACSTLFSVKVTYNFCPEETLINTLMTLPRTVAPANDSNPIRVEGSCAKDTVRAPGSLFVYCQSSGDWSMSGLQGRCICKEDLQNVEGKCQACPDGMYNDENGFNCSVLPSAPRNANATFVNQSAVEIRWLSPLVTGYSSHVFYEVECRKPCDIDDGNNCFEKSCSSGVNYEPYREGLNVTHVLVTNLRPFINYTFKVYAMNRVSEVAKRKHGVGGNFKVITLRTSGTVPGKPEVAVEQPEDAVVVSWKLEQKNGIIQGYHVTYIRTDDSSATKTLITKKMEHQFGDLKAGKTYEFQVFAENNFGKGDAGVKKFTLRNGQTSDKMIIFLGAGGGALVIIILVIIIIIVLRRRRGHRSVEKDYMRTIEQGSALQSMDSMDQRRYIDPGNYLDLLELLSTFTSELERSKTKLEGLIGQGEFADVYKGTLRTQDGRDLVAVKVLRPGSSEKNQKDFLSEASIMGQFSHPNVIRLIGVVTQSRPMMIITEFLESGSLDHFLKARDGLLTILQLLGMARGVASGMLYLSGMNFIHRDLAARNVLVGENMSCKVSDFGLSRELADDNPDSEYQTQGGKIPVRWTAPEALQHRKFSSASDVWSFGILVWEIMSFSDRPYWDWNNYDVINRVETGYRLPPPKGCPKVVHSLMLDCWDEDKNKRPKFSEILSRLDELIRSPECLKDNSLSIQCRSLEGDIPDFRSVDEWLKYINMAKYSETFKAANINTLDRVTKMEENDLKAIGIKLIGHRNKMSKSIKAMKLQFHNKALDDDEAAI